MTTRTIPLSFRLNIIKQFETTKIGRILQSQNTSKAGWLHPFYHNIRATTTCKTDR